MELPQEFCPRFQLNPEHSRADLGVGRRGPGHPFFLKFCSIFHRIKYLYSWPVKKGSDHPFVHFLNPPLVFRVATKSPNLIFQNRNKQRVHSVSYPIPRFAVHCKKIRSQAFAHSFSYLARLPESCISFSRWCRTEWTFKDLFIPIAKE